MEHQQSKTAGPNQEVKADKADLKASYIKSCEFIREIIKIVQGLGVNSENELRDCIRETCVSLQDLKGIIGTLCPTLLNETELKDAQIKFVNGVAERRSVSFEKFLHRIRTEEIDKAFLLEILSAVRSTFSRANLREGYSIASIISDVVQHNPKAKQVMGLAERSQKRQEIEQAISAIHTEMLALNLLPEANIDLTTDAALNQLAKKLVRNLTALQAYK